MITAEMMTVKGKVILSAVWVETEVPVDSDDWAIQEALIAAAADIADSSTFDPEVEDIEKQ